MHDIHLANQIATLVRESGKKNGIKVIKKIKIALGSLSEHGQTVSPDNLEFNIRLLLDDDVDVKIERHDGDKWELIEIEGN